MKVRDRRFWKDSRRKKANHNFHKKKIGLTARGNEKNPAATRKGAHMNWKMNKKWVALLAVLMLAVSMPAVALADADITAPAAMLYSPTFYAAATENQKIILSLSEKVTLVSGISITVSDGTATYIADAASGTLVGDAIADHWYAVYDLGDFTSDGTPLKLAINTTYTVNVNAGAFADLAVTPNTSAAASGSFTTADDATKFAVVYTTSASGQSATAGGTPFLSGQAIASGVTVAFSIPAQSYYTVHTLVKVNGSSGSFSLGGDTLTNDLEVYITRTQVTTLTGTPVITGKTYYGQTLSADLSGLSQPDLSGIHLKWVRVEDEALLKEGDKNTTYMIAEEDIGKIIRLDVTDATLTGTQSASTEAITKAPYASAVIKPVPKTVTKTSVELQSVSGYEYMRTGIDWQDSTLFSGLNAGESYDFYQRAKATTTVAASDTSEKTAIKALTDLTGSAVISGTVQSGKTLTGSLSGSNGSGTISYLWQRGGATVGSDATYLLKSDDVGQVITLSISTNEQTGTLTISTDKVLKAENTTTPEKPTMGSATATSITLNTFSGYEYSLGGIYWQPTPTFHNLVAGATYTFYQRVAETIDTLVSAPSGSVNFSTLPALTGTLTTTGEARYGITMTAALSGGNNTGTLSYTWKRGNTVAGMGTVYVVSAADIGNQLTLEVTSSVQGGVVSKSLGTVAKAYYIGDTPDAPTRYSRSTSKIVLATVSGMEYSRGGTTWQDSPTFSGLKSGTSYTFYQRYKASATTEASPASDPYKTSTSAASSSDDDTSTTPKPSATSSGSTALYSYTLTQDNTRILYSTMKSLAEGNKTQDVTIKQADVEFTFPKGTMTQTYTQLWYDFGASINSSIAAQTAEEIAGDAYVATVHYNYSGELPGKANIRLNIGAAQAGKTLYYYLLNADNTMTFQQTAVVDSSGWASVSQTHCSDYVFLSSEINSISPSPSLSPSPDVSASPLPSPTASPEIKNEGIGSDGWFIAAIILIAVALIVGGIWLYTKNRQDRIDDEDENDNNDLF